jgi:hypothetical protein
MKAFMGSKTPSTSDESSMIDRAYFSGCGCQESLPENVQIKI